MKRLHVILLQNKILKSQLLESRGLEKLTQNVPNQLQETVSFLFALGKQNLISRIFAQLIAEIGAIMCLKQKCLIF